MDIGLLDDNKIEIGMKGYIQEAINVFDEEMSTKVSYPENKNLHKVNQDSPTLPKNQAEYFHSIFAKLYKQLYNHNQILKLQLIFLVLELIKLYFWS